MEDVGCGGRSCQLGPKRTCQTMVLSSRRMTLPVGFRGRASGATERGTAREVFAAEGDDGSFVRTGVVVDLDEGDGDLAAMGSCPPGALADRGVAVEDFLLAGEHVLTADDDHLPPAGDVQCPSSSMRPMSPVRRKPCSSNMVPLPAEVAAMTFGLQCGPAVLVGAEVLPVSTTMRSRTADGPADRLADAARRNQRHQGISGLGRRPSLMVTPKRSRGRRRRPGEGSPPLTT